MQTFIIIAMLFLLAVLGSGCQTASSATTSSDAPAPAPTAKAAESVRETAVDTTLIGSLATPTDAYKTAYELRRKKDIAGLKKVMSKDVLEFLTLMGQDDKKSLDDMLREMTEKPQAPNAEVRNEKIKGDRAELEYLTETGGWKTMDFEKVDGKWLMSFPKADKPAGSEPEL
jgi:hypothetical protein